MTRILMNGPSWIGRAAPRVMIECFSNVGVREVVRAHVRDLHEVAADRASTTTTDARSAPIRVWCGNHRRFIDHLIPAIELLDGDAS